MTVALGIDGGGTHTRCLVLDENGTVIGVGAGGASKPDAVDSETGRANLHTAVLEACQSVGGAAALDSIFAGMGGVVSAGDVQVVRSLLEGLGFRREIPISIDHDIRIALAGGLAGKPGIALIVGTGTSCYGRNAAGISWRAGGWGYIIDDFGGGFYLGQHGLMAAVRAVDRRGPDTALVSALLEALGLDDMNAIMHRIYHPRLDYAAIAGLAPVVLRLAEKDPSARLIVERGCEELGHMVMVTARQLDLEGDVPVVASGGLVDSSPFYRTVLEKALKRALRETHLLQPIVSPVVGAALLALEQVGITLSEIQLAQLADSLKT